MMSRKSSSQKSVRSSPRHNLRPSPSMGVPTGRRRRRPSGVDLATVVGKKKSLKLKLINLKSVGDIINIEYGKKEKLALNSKYSVTEVLKTLSLQDVHHSRGVINLQKPSKPDQRENEPMQVTNVKQESLTSVISPERAQSVAREENVTSQRRLHRVCKLCKVGFITSELFALHDCLKGVVEPNPDVQISVESKMADPQIDTKKLSKSNAINEASSKEIQEAHLPPEPTLSWKTSHQNDLPAPVVSSPSVEKQKEVPQKISKTHPKEPKKRISLIDWLPEPMTVSVGYDAGRCICVVCGSKTHSLQALLLHFLPRPTIGKCNTCETKFTSNCQRFVHNLENHQFLCPLCTAKFQTRALAVAHTRHVHGDKDSYMVQSFNFTRDEQPPVDLQKLPVPSSMLQVQLFGEVNNRNHARKVICGKVNLKDGFPLKNLLELQSSYLTSENNVSKPIKCLLCTQALVNYKVLEEHMLKFHTFESYKDLERSVDEKVEKVAESALIQVESENSKSVMPYCRECRKVFQDIRALRRHRLSVHSVSTAYRLSLSQKFAKSKNRDLPTGMEEPKSKETGLFQKEELTLKGKVSKEGEQRIHTGNRPKLCKKQCASDSRQIDRGCKEEDAFVDVEKIDSEDEHGTITKEKHGQGETRCGIVPISEAGKSQSTASTSNGSVDVPKVTAKARATQVRCVEDGIDAIHSRTRPSVVRSRQCPSKEASWYLPDALFSMSAHRVTTKGQVREVDSLISRTLNELDIGKLGCSADKLFRPSVSLISSAVAAYIKLRPVLDNLPRTPTARRNYEPNPKYQIPMGHLNPEFEEMPLFPTLSDVFKRTNGYKHSPLQVMTAKEIKKTVAMDKSKESKQIRKQFAHALEDVFLVRVRHQVSAVARGHAAVQLCYNSQAHSYLSGRICGHIKGRLSSVVDKHPIPPRQPAHHQQVLLPTLTGLPPLMGPMTVAGVGPQRNCLQQAPVGATPQITLTKPSQANLKNTPLVAGRPHLTLNGKKVSIASHAAQSHLLQTNQYKTMPAASKSFLSLNGTGIATVVNVQSQPVIQSMERRLLPCSRSFDSGRDNRTVPNHAPHISVNEHTQSSANPKYPPTVLRVPLSALQHIGSLHSTIPSSSPGSAPPSQNLTGHIGIHPQSSMPPTMVIKVPPVQGGSRLVNKPDPAVHSVGGLPVLPGSNAITQYCVSQSSLIPARVSTSAQQSGSIPPVLSATNTLKQQSGSVVPSGLAVKSSLNSHQSSVKPCSISTSHSLYTRANSVIPIPSYSVSKPHPNATTTSVKSSHPAKGDARPSIPPQGQTSSSLPKMALPPLKPMFSSINQMVSQPLRHGAIIASVCKPNNAGISMTQVVGGSMSAPPPLHHSSELFRHPSGLSSSQTTHQPENEQKQKHAIARSPQEVIQVVGKKLTSATACEGPKVNGQSLRLPSQRSRDIPSKRKTPYFERRGTLTHGKRKLLSMDHSYSIQSSSHFRPNKKGKRKVSLSSSVVFSYTTKVAVS